MSLVSCKCGCGQKIESATAYKVLINGCQFKFLSESHYLKWSIRAKEKRGEFSDKDFIKVYNIVSDIITHEEGAMGYLKQKYDEWLKIATLSQIVGYLTENKEYLRALIHKKEIVGIQRAIAYLGKIVEQHAPAYKKEEVIRAGKNIQVVEEKRNTNDCKKRKSLSELEDEL